MEINHTTIYRWIGKYVRLMDKYLADFKPQVSYRWKAGIEIEGENKWITSIQNARINP